MEDLKESKSGRKKKEKESPSPFIKSGADTRESWRLTVYFSFGKQRTNVIQNRSEIGACVVCACVRACV